MRKQMFTSVEYYLELCDILPYQIDLSGHFSSFWRNQTGSVCAGQQKQDMVEPPDGVTYHITVSLARDFLTSERTLTDESRKQSRWRLFLSLAHFSLTTQHYPQPGGRISAAIIIIWFIHSSLSLQTPVRHPEQEGRKGCLQLVKIRAGMVRWSCDFLCAFPVKAQ